MLEIVVRQISGLGNQLFQYAAGRYYARVHGASLRVAVEQAHRALSVGVYPRPFLLSHFSLAAPAAEISRWDRFLLSRARGLPALSLPIRKAMRIAVVTEPVEQRYRFLPRLSVAAGIKKLYLLGYWQAHGFADGVEEQLREELRFREDATGRNAETLRQIRGSEQSVSLHIRRGDYALASVGNLVLPGSYYRQAIARIRERLTDPVFYVFSDDIAFARETLPRDVRTVFVDHNDDFSSHEDLRLMSNCRHHILANSSFSWWGAWLNAWPDRVVIAPRHWHLHPDSYFANLLPPAWMLLDTNREQG